MSTVSLNHIITRLYECRKKIRITQQIIEELQESGENTSTFIEQLKELEEKEKLFQNDLAKAFRY